MVVSATRGGNITYDVAIIGGGLAGLCLSIQLSRAGYQVALYEKEKYPFHKVCGEYISLESWNFLQEIGIPLSDWNLPAIKKLLLTAPDGNSIEHELPLGGFGISRYKLDGALADIAVSSGVHLFQNTKINEVVFENKFFMLQSSLGEGSKAKVVCGCFGKRSNLDVKWKRKFARQKNDKLNNYIAVKYHVEIDFPDDLIALHNFKNGYCGISRIEEGKSCLCYLTTAKNLELNANSIAFMEDNILKKNPFLRDIFSRSRFLLAQPVTISQISFSAKNQVQDHILMVGDAAGMITPLCGNGMSMAMHASKIAYECILLFLQDKIERHEMEQDYVDRWNRQFNRRLRAGRLIQRFFGSELLTNILIRSVRPFPGFVSWLISKTHGEPF
ncbi:MAG: pyridine nucleotide-disulfide oxidoreductase [Bacteroidetes bacterium]|nr:MAG: pyridine nucleotide-disulfide oxidoreductase [Bacteroidota bacterium]